MPQRYEPGRYVCVSGTGWGDRIIEFGTHSRFSHVFGIETEDGGIIQAMPGGVVRAHITDYAGRPMVINTDPMDGAQQQALVGAMQKMVGIPYNDVGIVDDGLESLGLFWKWFADLANGDNEVICSQMLVLVGRAASYDWSCGKRLAVEVTPADLARRPGMQPLEVRI